MSKDDSPKNSLNADEEELRKTQQDIMRLKKKLEAQRKATELKQQEIAQNKSPAKNSKDLTQNVYNSEFYAEQGKADSTPRAPSKAGKKAKGFISGENAWEAALDPETEDELESLFSNRGKAQTRPDSADYTTPQTPAPTGNSTAPRPNNAPVDSGKFRIPINDTPVSDRNRAVFEARPMNRQEPGPTDSRSNLRARPDLQRRKWLGLLIKLGVILGGGMLVLTLIGSLGIYMGWHNKLPLSTELKQTLSAARDEVLGKEQPAPVKGKATTAKPPSKILKTRPIPKE